MNMRDARKPWELSKEDLNALIRKFEDITETKFNDAFADQINNFIGIIREKYLIQENLLSKKDVERELKKLRNTLRKAKQIEDEQFSHNALIALISALPNRMEEYVKLSNSIEILADACNTAIEENKHRKKPKEFSFLRIKQAMATELAREMALFGIRITAYRDGIFGKCLREFSSSINGQANGKEFRVYVADDLFQLIKTAKENYTKPERFILLNFR